MARINKTNAQQSNKFIMDRVPDRVMLIAALPRAKRMQESTKYYL